MNDLTGLSSRVNRETGAKPVRSRRCNGEQALICH